MEHTLEHRIRQRAYEIWRAQGQTDGNADEHWLAAEREVLSSVIAQSRGSETNAMPKSPKGARANSRKAARAQRAISA
jgi:hypothetical protein